MDNWYARSSGMLQNPGRIQRRLPAAIQMMKAVIFGVDDGNNSGIGNGFQKSFQILAISVRKKYTLIIPGFVKKVRKVIFLLSNVGGVKNFSQIMQLRVFIKHAAKRTGSRSLASDEKSKGNDHGIYSPIEDNYSGTYKFTAFYLILSLSIPHFQTLTPMAPE
jgi:hypothetical protein